jgi:hypothetical protein
MIMVGSQSVAGEDVKGEDQKRGDADREIKNVKHADDLRGARWKEPAEPRGAIRLWLVVVMWSKAHKGSSRLRGCGYINLI